MTALEGRVGALEESKPKAHVVKTWTSGNNWYRKWSDGYIEQGGLFTSTSSKRVTFHVAFAGTPVAFSLGSLNSSACPTYRDLGYGVDNTGFSSYGGGASGGYEWKWYACGY